MGGTPNGWFIKENHGKSQFKRDDLGVPLFQETTMLLGKWIFQTIRFSMDFGCAED